MVQNNFLSLIALLPHLFSFLHRILKGIIAAFLFSIFPFPFFPFSLSPEGCFSAMWICAGWDIQSTSFLLCLKTTCGLFTHSLSIKRKFRGSEREENCREPEWVPGQCEQETSAAVAKELLVYLCACVHFILQIVFLVRNLSNYLC